MRPGLHVQIPSSLDEVAELIDRIMAFTREVAPGANAFDVELIARELIVNAICHGNRGIEGARVKVSLETDQRRLWMSVEDMGPGFDWRAKVEAGMPPPEALEGRGLPLMSAQCCEVRFNPAGNRVTVAFELEAAP